MSKQRTVLFDCDGTLVDSEILAMGVAIERLANATEKLRPNVKIERAALVQEFAGWHFDKMIPEMEKRYNVTLDADDLQAHKKVQTLTALKNVVACGGMMDFLRTTKRDIALVTSSEFERVNLCLEVTGIDAHFPEERKYSAHNTLPTPIYKPDPAIYNHALKVLGLKPEDAVAIEDSTSGATSAARAHISTVGYIGASHIPVSGKAAAAQSLIACGASVVISHMDDLEAAILSIENPDAAVSFKHKVYQPAVPVSSVPALPTYIPS